MNKKVIIIIVVVAIIGVAIWLYLKNKKAKTTTTSSNALASATPSASPALNLAVSTPIATAQAATTKSVVANQPGVTGNFTRAILANNSQQQTILRFEPNNFNVNVNDKIQVLSGPYAGIATVWYIYDGTRSGEPNVRNLYIDKPFVGDAAGQFVKV